MAKRGRSKGKLSEESINTKLSLLMKSGKACMGYQSVIKSLYDKEAKLVIISNNCPEVQRGYIEYCAMLNDISVQLYTGSNIELGSACGKTFNVGMLSVLDPGEVVF